MISISSIVVVVLLIAFGKVQMTPVDEDFQDPETTRIQAMQAAASIIERVVLRKLISDQIK